MLRLLIMGNIKVIDVSCKHDALTVVSPTYQGCFKECKFYAGMGKELRY